MAILPTKTMTSGIILRNHVRLPQVVIEEHGLTKTNGMQVIYGKNYSAIVVIPNGIKPNERMLERISILVNEQLT
jgi:hypothetical protein